MVFFSGCIGTPDVDSTSTTVETPEVEETTTEETDLEETGEETTEETGEETTEETGEETIGDELGPITHIVEITANGFNPDSITISLGDTVSFVNQDVDGHWPASDVHPTHGNYPEAGGCIGSAFDACGGLAGGESYLFTFDEVGIWTYHDHVNPGLTGKVIVE